MFLSIYTCAVLGICIISHLFHYMDLVVHSQLLAVKGRESPILARELVRHSVAYQSNINTPKQSF